MSQREIYIARMKLQLDELNLKMAELEAEARDARNDAKSAYQAQMTKLRQQSKDAATKLEELKLAGEDVWDKMVAEMEKLRDAVAHSFNYFKSQV